LRGSLRDGPFDHGRPPSGGAAEEPRTTFVHLCELPPPPPAALQLEHRTNPHFVLPKEALVYIGLGTLLLIIILLLIFA
jgi:hypothetical protein